MAYRIESRVDGIWAAEHVGDVDANRFDTLTDALSGIDELRNLGPDWADSDYRVVEFDVPSDANIG